MSFSSAYLKIKWPKSGYTAVTHQDDEDNYAGKETSRYIEDWKTSSRWKSISRTLHCALTVVLVVLVVILAMLNSKTDDSPGSFSSGWDTDFISAHGVIETKHVRFTGSPSFHTNKTIFIPDPGPVDYVGSPSPEIDANWEKLTWGRYILITEDEARASWGEDIERYWDNQRGGYVAGLDMFHTLHCLNNMRKTLYPDYYGKAEMDHNHILHQSHCIEQLRQYIMCSGDMTPIPTVYYPALGRNYVDSDVLHTCRNFEKLREWTVDRYEGATAIKPAHQ